MKNKTGLLLVPWMMNRVTSAHDLYIYSQEITEEHLKCEK